MGGASVDRRDVAEGGWRTTRRRGVGNDQAVRKRRARRIGIGTWEAVSGKPSAGNRQPTAATRGSRQGFGDTPINTCERRQEADSGGAGAKRPGDARENPGRPRRPVVVTSHPDQAGSANCATAERSASA
ncbi:hypothetical protein WS70_23580 [Burkholderia mayonis]|uniref:Uncharacterized protein n=1 Tax=Burkholderia mayonis TaxID=1385591 RepID=A0A1B4FM53_9BURK|nr:hypothetical protein WS70_23580 [Burkholderia mayonis]KVE41288.1 hypothetical protein WS70_14805 [Burkholderia mayonis]